MYKDYAYSYTRVVETRERELYLVIKETLISLDGKHIVDFNEYNKELHHITDYRKDIIKIHCFDLDENDRPDLTCRFDVGDNPVVKFESNVKKITVHFADSTQTSVDRESEGRDNQVEALLYAICKRFQNKSDIERVISLAKRYSYMSEVEHNISVLLALCNNFVDYKELKRLTNVILMTD